MKAKKGEKKDKKKCNVMDFVKKNSKIVVPVCIAVVMLVIIGVVLSCTGGSSNVGNTISNIRNYGYSVSDGKWFYYVSPNDAGVLTEINKIKGNGKDDTVLYSTAKTIVSLNESGDYLYFIEVDTQTYFEAEDSVDNKIFRIKKDGSSATPELLNDNDLKVTFYVDKEFVDMNMIGVHPNDNTATVWIKTDDLINIIKEHGNEVCIYE